MEIKELRPHNTLEPFIDAYWEITCKKDDASINKVLPDGCVDLIINLGEDYHIECDNIVLKSEKAYL
ncbi:MAG TPA: DUF6597 domain-containing transcriptional factor, partial [Flavisolibacter sp.]|nr:DUF6597 domain-containing transcriptional factor [Flavisolibacter sp.]